MDQETRWQEKYRALVEYSTREGHTRVPANYTEKTESGTILLGDWVSHQRNAKRKGLMSPAREQKLAGLPGWEWGPLKKGPRKNEQRAQEITELHEQGLSLSQIADRVGLSRQRVHQILKGNK